MILIMNQAYLVVPVSFFIGSNLVNTTQRCGTGNNRYYVVGAMPVCKPVSD